MPRVTAPMIDWWFGWHAMESQRYKLWHPRAHLANRMERMIGDDPGLSDREKYLHNPNYVTEYIGQGRIDITITFSAASDFFGHVALRGGSHRDGGLRARGLPAETHLLRRPDPSDSGDRRGL